MLAFMPQLSELLLIDLSPCYSSNQPLRFSWLSPACDVSLCRMGFGNGSVLHVFFVFSCIFSAFDRTRSCHMPQWQLWCLGARFCGSVITLRASCGAGYCNLSCLFVCGWVCYHDNSKLCASILTKLGL